MKWFTRAHQPTTSAAEGTSLTDWSRTMDLAAKRELLRSELWRTALVLGTALLLLLLIQLLLLTTSESSPYLATRTWQGTFVLGLLVLYEAVVLYFLLRWRRQGQSSPTTFRYLNTVIEITIPTAAMLLLGTRMGLGPALAGAAPYVYFILIVFSALYLDFRLPFVAGVVAALEFGVLAFWALGATEPVPDWEVLTSAASYWIKAACLVLTGLATGFVAVQIRRQMRTAVRSVAERDHAVSMFGQHVSPQVAEMLLRQPIEFSGEERNVCVMFLDIRDFSRLAAERTPSQVMDYLNTLFGSLITIVNQHEGIVNKFLGDGFMAVFGAPVDDAQQCEHALVASQEILATVERLNQQGQIPTTRLGIGLHMGRAVTGNVGSPERKEYTIIGDVVNLASRIEQATKQFQASLLVSEAVQEKLDPSKHPAADLGLVELKGQGKPTRLFRLK